MRIAFHQQLDALIAAIAEMCALAGLAMQDATQALLHAAALAERVIADRDEIMFNAARAEEDAFTLLALQAPVAGDLRAVVASLKNVADAERMGALALHLAEIVRRRHPAHALPDEVNGYFADMGRIAVDLGNNAKDVVQSGDPRKAAELCNDDDAIGDLHRQLLSLLMDPEWKHGIAAAVDVTLLGRYYQRFADHAVEIARRVIFQATASTQTSILWYSNSSSAKTPASQQPLEGYRPVPFEPPFDRVVLCELPPRTAKQLERTLREAHPGPDLVVLTGDCNVEVPKYLQTLNLDWRRYAAVFTMVDQYSAEVSWEALNSYHNGGLTSGGSKWSFGCISAMGGWARTE
jgi:phosphate transport system protein